jgi:hypothetical protein
MLKGPEEVYVDFSNNPAGEYKTFVRNLAETDPKIAQRLKPVTKDNLNVLRLFVDTIALQRVFRRFKKMLPWLKDHHWSKKAPYRVYEFLRLQSLAGYTNPNLLASYYGVNPNNYSQNSADIMRYFQDAGYITGHVSDFCQTSPFMSNLEGTF